MLPGYNTVDVSNTSSEPEQSKDRATRDELPPDENRRRMLEANDVKASLDLRWILSPPLADRRRVTVVGVSPTSADACRRRCRSTSATSRQTNTAHGACRMMSSLTAPNTVRLSVLEPLRVPITIYEAFSSKAMRQTTSPGLPGHERSRAETFGTHHRDCTHYIPVTLPSLHHQLINFCSKNVFWKARI